MLYIEENQHNLNIGVPILFVLGYELIQLMQQDDINNHQLYNNNNNNNNK